MPVNPYTGEEDGVSTVAVNPYTGESDEATNPYTGEPDTVGALPLSQQPPGFIDNLLRTGATGVASGVANIVRGLPGLTQLGMDMSTLGLLRLVPGSTEGVDFMRRKIADPVAQQIDDLAGEVLRQPDPTFAEAHPIVSGVTRSVGEFAPALAVNPLLAIPLGGAIGAGGASKAGLNPEIGAGIGALSMALPGSFGAGPGTGALRAAATRLGTGVATSEGLTALGTLAQEGRLPTQDEVLAALGPGIVGGLHGTVREALGARGIAAKQKVFDDAVERAKAERTPKLTSGEPVPVVPEAPPVTPARQLADSAESITSLADLEKAQAKLAETSRAEVDPPSAPISPAVIPADAPLAALQPTPSNELPSSQTDVSNPLAVLAQAEGQIAQVAPPADAPQGLAALQPADMQLGAPAAVPAAVAAPVFNYTQAIRLPDGQVVGAEGGEGHGELARLFPEVRNLENGWIDNSTGQFLTLMEVARRERARKGDTQFTKPAPVENLQTYDMGGGTPKFQTVELTAPVPELGDRGVVGNTVRVDELQQAGYSLPAEVPARAPRTMTFGTLDAVLSEAPPVSGPPPAPPIAPAATTPAPEVPLRERKVTQRLSEGQGIAADWSEGARAILENITYSPRGPKLVMEGVAKEMAVGPDAAALRFFDPHSDMPADVRTVLGLSLAEHFHDTGNYDQWHNAIMRSAETGTSQGQAINAFKYLGGAYTEPARAQLLMQQEINAVRRRLVKQGQVDKVSKEVVDTVDELVADNRELSGVESLIKAAEAAGKPDAAPKSRMTEAEKFEQRMVSMLKRKNRPIDVAKFVSALLIENRNTLWPRYLDAIAKAVERAANPTSKPPAILQQLSADITKILTENLPKPSKPSPTALETAQKIETILRNPEKFREALALAKLNITNLKQTPATQHALTVLESLVAGESPVNTLIKKLLRQVFDELDTDPRKIAAQGSVKAEQIRGEVVKRVGELFTPKVANDVSRQVDALLATMLSDAREQLRTSLQSQEIRQTFNLVEKNAEADRLLASGTPEEITAFLGDRLPSEQPKRIAALRESLSKKRDTLRLKVLTPETIERRLLTRLKQKSIKAPGDLRNSIGQAVDLFNKGSLTPRGLEEVLLTKVSLPKMSPEIAAELANHARRIGSTPVGSFARRDATIALFDYVHQQIAPITGTDVAFALFYAHILAGYPTHVRNTLSNATAMLDIGLDALLTNPSQWADKWESIMRGGAAGAASGLTEAREVVQTGRRAINEEDTKFGTTATLEHKRFTGLAYPYNVSKFVGRLLRAEDVFFQAVTYEIKARQVAWELARDMAANGKIKPEEIADTVETLLNNQPQQISNARAMAEREWDELHPDLQAKTTKEQWVASNLREQLALKRRGEIVERASDLATRLTFNYRPEGLVGYFANALLDGFAGLRRAGQEVNTGSKKLDTFFRVLTTAPRIEVPFIRIPANIFARAWEFGSGVSIVKAAIGRELIYSGGGRAHFEKMSEDNRSLMMKRGIAGLAALAGIALLGWPSDDPEEERKRGWRVHGKGSGDMNRDRARYGPKWRPFSVEINTGKTTYFMPYQYLPFGPALAMVGYVHDGKRYQKFTDKEGELRLANAIKGLPASMLAQTFTRNIADAMDAINGSSRTSEEATRRNFARTTAGLAVQTAVPLANFWKSLENDFDPKVRDVTSIKASLMANVVGMRTLNRPRLDVLGDDVENRPGDWFFTARNNDSPEGRIFLTLAEHDLDPGDGSSYKQALGDRYYDFYKARQQEIKRQLLENKGELLNELRFSSDADAQTTLGYIARDATQTALEKVGYVPTEKDRTAGQPDAGRVAQDLFSEMSALPPAQRESFLRAAHANGEIPLGDDGKPSPEFVAEWQRLQRPTPAR